MIIIPVGLIVRVTIGTVKVIVATGTALFEAFWGLVMGSHVDRAFALVMALAPMGGYLSVTKLHLFGGRVYAGSTAPVTSQAVRAEPLAPQAVAEPTVDTMVWETFSADSHAVLSQHRGVDACVLTCRRDDAIVWEKPGECQGMAVDRHFVSNSCERSVVFHSKPPGKDRRFITVFDRTAVAWTVLDLGLTRVPSALARGNVIAGLAGNDGTPPRYSADGETVDFTVVDGTTQHVPLMVEPKDPTKSKR